MTQPHNLTITDNTIQLTFTVVYPKIKSPAIRMIAGLNFNIQMIYLSKKGRVKGRVLIDL